MKFDQRRRNHYRVRTVFALDSIAAGPMMVRMRVLPFFTSLLLLVPPLVHAADQAVEIDDGKAVVLSVPDGWTLGTPEIPVEMSTPGKTVMLSSKDHSSAKCLITLFSAPDNRLSDPKALRESLDEATQQLLPDSVEQKVQLRDFKTPHGSGCAATFTDARLVGKPPEPGNYKTATSVLIYLPAQIVVNATVLCDDVKGPEYETMLSVLRSLDTRKKSGAI
jgi:hypothetical protein